MCLAELTLAQRQWFVPLDTVPKAADLKVLYFQLFLLLYLEVSIFHFNFECNFDIIYLSTCRYMLYEYSRIVIYTVGPGTARV